GGRRLRTELPVNNERRVAVGREVASALVERGLQVTDNRAVRTLLQRRGLSTITTPRSPRLRAHDPIDREGLALAILDGLPGLRAEDSVEVRVTQRDPNQQILRPTNDRTFIAFFDDRGKCHGRFLSATRPSCPRSAECSDTFRVPQYAM